MFRYTLLTVAAYQVVTGVIALAMLLDAALRGGGSLGSLILAALAILYVVSGALLARKRPRFLWLASALQLAQVAYAITPWIQYYFAIGVDAGAALVVRAGPVSSAGITFRASPVAMFHAFVGKPTGTIVVGINMVALGMLVAIRHAAKMIRSEPTAGAMSMNKTGLVPDGVVEGEPVASPEHASVVAPPKQSSRL